MSRSMVKMSGKGDEMVAEYAPGVTSPERLDEIEAEFNAMMAKGYSAFNITDKENEQIRAFDPAVDILMVPVIQGG